MERLFVNIKFQKKQLVALYIKHFIYITFISVKQHYQSCKEIFQINSFADDIDKVNKFIVRLRFYHKDFFARNTIKITIN